MSGAVPSFIDSSEESELAESPNSESGDVGSNNASPPFVVAFKSTKRNGQSKNGAESNKTAKEGAAKSVYSEAIQFKANIKDITEKGYDTSAAKSNGVEWKIHLVKNKAKSSDDIGGNRNSKREEDKFNLDISLVGNFADDTENWSVDVEAEFVLFPKTGTDTYSKKTDQAKTINKNSNLDFKDFIEWQKLTDTYSNEGVAAFEIRLKVGKPNRHELERIWAKIPFPVRNINKDVQSPEVVVRGIRWHALSQRKTYTNGDAIAVLLYANSSDMDINLKWNVYMEFTLYSLKKDVEAVTKNVTHEFSWNDMNYGYISFLNWKDFTDTEKQFVVKDSAVFDVEFHVSEPVKIE